MHSVNSVNRCSFGVGEWSGPQLVSLWQWHLCANTVQRWHTGALRSDPFTLTFPLCHSVFPYSHGLEESEKTPTPPPTPYLLCSVAQISISKPPAPLPPPPAPYTQRQPLSFCLVLLLCHSPTSVTQKAEWGSHHLPNLYSDYCHYIKTDY